MFNFNGIPRTIWTLGLVSLLMDVSSEMVHGLLPVFLISVLHASYTSIGLIEGAGEAFSLVFKVISGPLSDWIGKRKPLVLLGYSMGALSKPLFAIATSPFMVLGARLFDRTGKGIRGAPRDALIADIAPQELRGAAYGLRQSLDTVGAFLGPLLAIFLMSASNGDYRFVFWMAVIPGLLSVVLIIFGVHDVQEQKSLNEKKLQLSILRTFSGSFWFVSAIGAILQMARFSEAFLILRAQDLGLRLALAPLILVAMNVVYSFIAYPMGRLSDRMPREWLLLIGFIVLAVSDLALAFATHLAMVFVGVILWGIHLGLTQGILAALVADTCPKEYRGTAYGFFNLLSAIALLIASTFAGYLWDLGGPRLTFTVSAGIVFVGMICFLLFRGYWSSRKHSDNKESNNTTSEN